VDKPLKSVTQDQCDARPTITFPVAEHRCPATGTKLYCLVTEAHVCEQLAQGRYLTAARPGVELATSRVASQRLNHYTTRPHTPSGHSDSAERFERKMLTNDRILLICNTRRATREVYCCANIVCLIISRPTCEVSFADKFQHFSVH